MMSLSDVFMKYLAIPVAYEWNAVLWLSCCRICEYFASLISVDPVVRSPMTMPGRMSCRAKIFTSLFCCFTTVMFAKFDAFAVTVAVCEDTMCVLAVSLMYASTPSALHLRL